MIPARLLPIAVTWVQPAATEDAYGNPMPDWGEDATRNDLQAWIEQQDTREVRDGRDQLVSTWLFITNELGVGGQDRIEWADRTFEVDGEPAVMHTPAGPHHLEARLLLVET